MTFPGISGTDNVGLGFPVHVVDTEGDFGVCTGVALDLDLYGLVARLGQPLPSTCETTVQVELPDGTEVVTGAVVAESGIDGEGWLYRLVFPSLEDADIRAISSLPVAQTAQGATVSAPRIVGGIGSEPRIDELLAQARATLPGRPQAGDLPLLRERGALVVDIRPIEQRERDGDLQGAVVIDRNVLEWRLDPTSPHRIPEASDPGREIVLVCNEGYASSLAAASLQRLGLRRATDLDGGFQAVLRHAASRALPD